jgi:hypothetical protein
MFLGKYLFVVSSYNSVHQYVKWNMCWNAEQSLFFPTFEQEHRHWYQKYLTPLELKPTPDVTGKLQQNL